MDFMPIYEDGDLIVEGTQTEVMPIDEDGDLIVEVTQTGNDPTAKTGSFTGTFRVNSDVMKKASQVFLAMLATARWKESSGSVVSLGENHVAVTELWLRVVHNAKLVHNLLFLEIWYLVQAIDYYALDATLFYPWFASAYAQNSHMLEDKPAQLLFPTWHFNHAKAFAKCTHDLAYGQVRAITEKNPSDIYEYHLPARQIQTLYDYQAHLCSINVWPLEEMFGGSSINDILRRLANFSFEPPATACEKCRQNYKRIVKGVISEVQGYFGGLCLDCIDKSKPKTGDVDIDYWMHAKIKAGDWSKGCRFRHGEPTWYFSFSGRKEDMDDFLDKWKAEEEERTSTSQLPFFLSYGSLSALLAEPLSAPFSNAIVALDRKMR
ncbi:MAG: hypothetical protein LQ344_007063 [Seirophora lacunosa]|nr:MAG: hypothetical protein LQ344_007063 [Seirophora lacunosa]